MDTTSAAPALEVEKDGDWQFPVNLSTWILRTLSKSLEVIVTLIPIQWKMINHNMKQRMTLYFNM